MNQVLEFRPTLPQQEQQQSYLVFSNPGVLEMDLVKLMGVSVKETADPIGFFGTGLKYAMATALRLGGVMTIFSDGERYEVRGRPVRLREKEFTQVLLNDEALGFTTELGKQWEPWMVVRELYSNAMDEAGDTSVRAGELPPAALDGRTVITLTGDCFLDVWGSRDAYFLTSRERADHRSAFVDAYPVLGHNHAVFYRGIKIYDTERPTLYRYNLVEDVTLTEDRTLKYHFQLREAMEKAIITSGDHEYIARSLTTGDGFQEGHLRFEEAYSHLDPSEAFKAVCGKLNERRARKLNMAAIRWYQKRTQTAQPLVPVSLTAVQQKQLAKASEFIRLIMSSDAIDRYPVQIVAWLGEGVFGQAKNGTIYLTPQAFDTGTKKLAAILLEEFVHNHYNLLDETREMQSWLFERIITIGEEFATREPL